VLVEVFVGGGAEVETEPTSNRRECQCGDERDFFAVAGAVEQTRRLSAWGQGATDQWTQKQAAFVEQDNSGPLASRPF
jgi:hypothetical protein